jgi:hypothetical protein
MLRHEVPNTIDRPLPLLHALFQNVVLHWRKRQGGMCAFTLRGGGRVDPDIPLTDAPMHVDPT